jgi:hypothetical protein
VMNAGRLSCVGCMEFQPAVGARTWEGQAGGGRGGLLTLGYGGHRGHTPTCHQILGVLLGPAATDAVGHAQDQALPLLGCAHEVPVLAPKLELHEHGVVEAARKCQQCSNSQLL